MADPTRPVPQPVPPTPPITAAPAQPPPQICTTGDAMACERCGAGMFRMHAVWRCPQCGYKTDCCGW